MIYIIIGYTIGAVLFYGYSFAFWQNKYDLIAIKERERDISFSIVYATVWPLSIIVWIIAFWGEKKYYGFKLK